MRHHVSNWSLREVLLAAAAGLFLAAGAWLGVASPPAAGAHDEQIARGAAVFRRERCVFCHTLEGGAAGAVALAPGDAPDLGREGGRRSDDWHRAHLIDPRAVVAGSAMPSYGHLPESDIAALVAFLQAQGTAPATPISSEAMPLIGDTLESYRSGQRLYRAHCAGCHGENGNGNGVVGQLLAPEPRDLADASWMSKQSDARLFEVISTGIPGTAMPGYRDGLSPDERAVLVRYLRYFADPVAKQFMEQGLPRPATVP